MRLLILDCLRRNWAFFALPLLTMAFQANVTIFMGLFVGMRVMNELGSPPQQIYKMLPVSRSVVRQSLWMAGVLTPVAIAALSILIGCWIDAPSRDRSFSAGLEASIVPFFLGVTPLTGLYIFAVRFQCREFAGFAGWSVMILCVATHYVFRRGGMLVDLNKPGLLLASLVLLISSYFVQPGRAEILKETKP